MVRPSLVLLVCLVHQLLVVAALDDSWGVVLRIHNPKATRKDKRKCKKYDAQLNAKLEEAYGGFVVRQRRTQEQEVSHHRRKLYNCRDICANIPLGWCQYVSAGLCSNRYRGLRRGLVEKEGSSAETSEPPTAVLPTNHTPESTSSNTRRHLVITQNFVCQAKIPLAMMVVLNFAASLTNDAYCKNFYLEEFQYKCIFVDSDY